MKRTLLILILSLIALDSECGATPLLEKQRLYQPHGNGWKEFETLHKAAKDLGAGKVKVSGIPSILLGALSKRIGALVPSSAVYKAGCIVGADQLAGPSSWRGTHDLLMKPNTDGTCRTPALQAQGVGEKELHMQWDNESNPPKMPPVAEVYDTVFARRTRSAMLPKDSDPALSFWFLSFVNWFHDDNFRTLPGTNGSFTWSDASGLHMSQLYGHTPYRQSALRTLAGDGKMKTSSMGGWDSYPPLWSDIKKDYPEFEMWTPTQGPSSSSSAANKTQEHVDNNMEHYFAIGDPRFNLHAGHVVWTSIGLFLHNTACDILMEQTSRLWTDEDVFQRARVMTFHIIQKIRLQDFVSDSVSHVRDHTRIGYDPPVLRELLAPHFPFSAAAKPNFLEFNHVYQAWHSLIPDHLVLNGTNVPLHQTMWSPRLFQHFSISDLAAAFSDTRIAKYGPHNFPFFTRGVTEEALSNERAQRLPSYNAYRQYVGLEPLTSFDQFAVDNPAEMAQLYDNQIDNVEFLTGVIADSNAELEGNFMGDTQLIIVSIFALQDVANSALVQNPLLWSEEYLTGPGLQWIKDFEFRDLLETVLLSSGNYPCPFQTTDSQDAESCHQPQEWKEPQDVGSCFMDSSRVCSYVGVDFTEWFYYENGYMRVLLLQVFISLGLITILYVSAFVLVSRFWPMEGQARPPELLKGGSSDEPAGDVTTLPEGTVSESGESGDQTNVPSNAAQLSLETNNNRIFHQRLRLCSLMINFSLSATLCIPTSFVWYSVHSDPYWIQKFGESTYVIPGWTVILVGIHFVAEIAMRLAQWRFTANTTGSSSARSIFIQLTVHHLGFFAFGILYTYAADVAVFKMGFTVLTAWLWEWTMFLAFFVMRVFDATYETWRQCPGDDGLCVQQTRMFQSRAYRCMVFYGLPLLTIGYFATRILEAVVLVQLFICSLQRGVPHSSAAASFWALSAIACLLVGLQLHAGLLLTGLYQRRKRPLVKWMAQARNRGDERSRGGDGDVTGPFSILGRSIQDSVQLDDGSTVHFNASLGRQPHQEATEYAEPPGEVEC
ncbi:Prostaglandin G/H synthase 2 [Seminavis robusta]|uniref:Prostaglandin G/H synthase 2 n=1 Tax=Seminavis robusta TaxID=568900 RepID=A0A9N8H4J7_9STRA|nr:Prostaglandin G/H synthase 2 [Seminavis robusta]|eukprot:Sro65_g036680.1 Prostaglandin G/H synthase 2 (1055) ;mRNA; f:46829-49993